MWYIHNGAYDLTNWMDDHPGGRYILEATKGTDCTALFEMYHSSATKSKYIHRQLQRHKVFHLEEDDDDDGYEWDNTPVYDDMKKIVTQYRQLHGITAYDAGWTMILWYTVWGAMHLLALCEWINGTGGALLLGVTMWFFSGDLLHSGTHYCLTHNPRTSESIGWWCGWMFMIPSGWTRQHVLGHHTNTNVPQKDPDLYHYSRMYKSVDDYSDDDGHHHTTTSLLALLLMPLYTQWTPSFFLYPRLVRNNRWKGVIHQEVWTTGERALGMATWAALWSGVAAVGSVHGPIHAATPFLVVSVIYYLFSQVSHMNLPSMNDNNRRREWAVAQCMAAQGDYSYNSTICNYVSVGLNNQTMHHLFPNVHWCHYPALSALMKPVFLKHNLPTRGWNQTYMDSLNMHIRFVKQRVQSST